MHRSFIILWLIIIFCIMIPQRRQQVRLIEKHIKQKRENKERTYMKELVMKFIGKECVIYTMNSQMVGVIKEVSENGGAIGIENKNNVEIVNLDYVTRIREVPRNKKGKKKSIVID